MSRIGRKPVSIPAGVTVKVENGNVTISGPKGTLVQDYDNKVITVKVENNEVIVSRANDVNHTRAKHGLYRALINNMVKGVTEGFERNLEIKGVGYKAQVQGNKLVLNLGYSHPIEMEAIEGIKIECPTMTTIKISGIDKQKVGQFASNIRDLRPVEPYHGYGVRYDDEYVIRKVGKAAGKGKK